MVKIETTSVSCYARLPNILLTEHYMHIVCLLCGHILNETGYNYLAHTCQCKIMGNFPVPGELGSGDDKNLGEFRLRGARVKSTNAPFLYHLKTSENVRFSVFRG